MTASASAFSSLILTSSIFRVRVRVRFEHFLGSRSSLSFDIFGPVQLVLSQCIDLDATYIVLASFTLRGIALLSCCHAMPSLALVTRSTSIAANFCCRLYFTSGIVLWWDKDKPWARDRSTSLETKHIKKRMAFATIIITLVFFNVLCLASAHPPINQSPSC